MRKLTAFVALAVIGACFATAWTAPAQDEKKDAAKSAQKDDANKGDQDKGDQDKGDAPKNDTSKEEAAPKDQPATPADPGTPKDQPPTAPAPDQAAPAAPANDQDFVAKAAVGGSFEVYSSRLALQRSQNPQIRQFAQQMVNDHTNANNQLLRLAGVKRIPVPRNFDPPHQAMYDRLNRATDPAQFDREYARGQSQAHDEAVALFQAGARIARDPDLKNLATQTLPILQHHQRMAKQLEGQVR